MDLTIVILGLSIHKLVWEKLPDWGTWFNAILAKLPRPLSYLYEAWRCPYCFGFWIALVLQYVTGIKTLSAMQQLPITHEVTAAVIAAFLDALAAALLIMVGSLLTYAIAGPAMSGHEKIQAFKRGQHDS